LRDGEPMEAYVAQHVNTCVACSRELERLRSVRVALATLPTMTAPAYNLLATREHRQSIVGRSLRTVGTTTLAAGIGAVVLLVTFTMRMDRSRETATSSTAAAATDMPLVAATQLDRSTALPDDPPMATLVKRSQDLESRLRRLPNRPHIERASTTTTIDSLQSRIQWVDYQLLVANDVGLNERQAALLWEDRIQLMDSLVKVRYAEAQRFALLQ
jgi:hypothetical protein